MPEIQTVDPHYTVSVLAPARLHLGFIDMGGALGRMFGSIGVGINEIFTRLSISKSERLQVMGYSSERAEQYARRLTANLGIADERVSIRIHQSIPEHVGLGSGTQLALAVGMGLMRYHRLKLGVRDVARHIERGRRSGIGIGVFEQGGLIVDGGRGAHTETPPLLARHEFPPSWRFILVFDPECIGLSGTQEVEAFRHLPMFPIEETARLCHLLLMQALPALVERDIQAFGAVITELQQSIGNHFAPAQGGGRFTSPAVGEAVHWLQQQGAVGIGQTSWGPTGFCMTDTPTLAEALSRLAKQQFPKLNFVAVSGRNQGADILPANLEPQVEFLRS